MNRLAALQAWPPFSIRPTTAASTTDGRSSVSSTRYASEPPSSSTTFLRCCPASAATAVPARSLPVTETPRTRGSAMMSATCSLRREEVHVRIGRHPGVVEELLHRERRLGALRRVLEQDRVARHQVRAGEPGHLVVGVVPRHDPEQRADGRLADDRAAAGARRDRLVGQQRGPLVGVVAVDVDDELDLAHGLGRGLAHLARDDGRELLRARWRRGRRRGAARRRGPPAGCGSSPRRPRPRGRPRPRSRRRSRWGTPSRPHRWRG